MILISFLSAIGRCSANFLGKANHSRTVNRVPDDELVNQSNSGGGCASNYDPHVLTDGQMNDYSTVHELSNGNTVYGALHDYEIITYDGVRNSYPWD